MQRDGIATYRKTRVVTTNAGGLVLMCYQGMVDQLKMAKQAYEEGDFERKYSAIEKAQGIIEELLCSLDHEKGGDIAKNLDALYRYVSRQIVKADLGKNPDGFDEPIHIFSELKSAWETIVKAPPNAVSGKAIRFSNNTTAAGSHLSA